MMFKLRVISATSPPGPPSCANTGVATINHQCHDHQRKQDPPLVCFLDVFISHSPAINFPKVFIFTYRSTY